jgi:Rod binding domain-containing protein
MSDLSATDLSALSSLDPSAMPTVLPPDVRAAGAKGEQLYQAALGFEQLLTQSLTDQLASQMSGTDSTDGSDSSDSAGGSDSTDDPSTESIFPTDDASSSMLSEMLPQALSNGITAAGGLGVAHQLYLMLAQQSGISTFTGSGATAASGTAPTTPSSGTGSSTQ